LFLLVSAIRLVRFHRALAGAAMAPAEIQQMAAGLAQRCGVAPRYRLRITEGRLSPLVWAIGRPTVLLPRALLTELSPEEIETLLAHELAHLRRRDHWLRWLELLVTASYWWHPIVWWARAVIHRAEEEACDAWVVSVFPDASMRYASALFKAVQFASDARQAKPLMASGLGSGGTLKERIENIMNAKWSCRISLPARLAVAATALLILPLSVEAVWGGGEQPFEADAQNLTGAKAESVDQPTSNEPTDDSQPSRPAQTVPKLEDERRDPYRIQPGDTIHVWVYGTPEDAPIMGNYRVEPGGTIALGPLYGRVTVRGMSLELAEDVITEQLSQVLKAAKVQVTLGKDSRSSLFGGFDPSIERPGAEPIESSNPVAAQSYARPSADELAALREHLKFLENHYQRIDALFQTGSVGGSAEAHALAAYELAVAQGELALTEGRRSAATRHFEEAETFAERALAAIEAAHSAGAATHDLLLQAAKNVSDSKRRLIATRRQAQSSQPSESNSAHELRAALRELIQSTPAPSTTESIGVLRKMVERAENEYGRLMELGEEQVVSQAEIARAKSDYEISVERLRQAERGLKYHRAVLDAAVADYEVLAEINKQSPQAISAAELRRA
jgi:multidrug resistance efflux pump